MTGPALALLRKAHVAKARAPIGTLVAVEELATIAQAYNSRGPKHPIEGLLDGLVWNSTIASSNTGTTHGADTLFMFGFFGSPLRRESQLSSTHAAVSSKSKSRALTSRPASTRQSLGASFVFESS